MWRPALQGMPERQMVKGHKFRPAVKGADLDDPQPTPHDLRHSFGTRLADEGVPLHDIMALMGHEDVRSAQRYLHSREERFDRARQALRRARGGS
ncbi:phage integrase family protein [Salinispora arenicola]|nr:phage integrase family protein [Salinispora arenicola]NIL64339.1 phage integrase family protein [Salinispora arenicola]